MVGEVMNKGVILSQRQRREAPDGTVGDTRETEIGAVHVFVVLARAAVMSQESASSQLTVFRPVVHEYGSDDRVVSFRLLLRLV